MPTFGTILIEFKGSKRFPKKSEFIESSKGEPYRVLASLVLELHWRRGDVGGRECLSKIIF